MAHKFLIEETTVLKFNTQLQDSKKRYERKNTAK